MATFEPILDRVLCRDHSYVPKTLVTQTDAEEVFEAEVVAVPMISQGAIVAGGGTRWERVPDPKQIVRIGDRILFNPVGREPVTVNGEKFILLRIPDIYGIVRA